MSLATMVEVTFNDFVSRIIDEKTKTLRTACREVTKEIREDIHDQWKPNGYASLSGATEYHTHLSKGENTITCTTTTWVDSGHFKPGGDKTDEWKSRHDGIGIDGREWILQLQMYQGLIALPLYSNQQLGWAGDPRRSKWSNPAPNPKSDKGPLESWTANAPMWNEFEKKVISRL